ncbi:MAG: DUF2062 domain-containing protein [Candidatus Omnitrophica bacterium]|nr:DUF2062 domain-containing protein [Candidatus Omnitrophota bacterium]
MRNNKLSRFFNLLYTKLFKINDTPHKIALGLGLGVSSGIIPGTGPIAAISLALLFKANRAAALLGCLLTNTWLSFVIIIFAIKTGSAILNSNWQSVQQDWSIFLVNFHWSDLFNVSVLEIIFPVIIGYLLVGLALGTSIYIITFTIISIERNRRIK